MIQKSISDFRQHFLEIAKNNQNAEGVLILRNYKPIGVYLSYEKWQEIESILAEQQQVAKEINMTEFWAETKKKLKNKSRDSVLTQEEIDRLSYDA
jgi:PHD/YefM family antitoxin component YafN of YafNO toxin-antitoxin module